MVCRNIDNRLKAFAVAFAFMMFAPFCTLLSQHIDKELFQRFEKRFALIDSLIFPQGQPPGTTQGNPQFLFPAVAESVGEDLYDRSVDSLLQEKTDNRKAALKAESGLLVSGQTYYRLDENMGYDDEDALSRYSAKMQVELRWNFLSSSLVKRESRLNEIGIMGELERAELYRKRVRELTDKQKEFFQFEYDSLLSGVMRLRIDNLKLLNQVQTYLVSDRSIATEDLLKLMDEQAIAERQLAAIPGVYPVASQLAYPDGAIISIDTVALKKHIAENEISLHQARLQIELLHCREENTSYWRTLNISPFVRYSYYVRPDMKNSANVDAGIAFQIPLSSQSSRQQKAIRSERIQKIMEKDALAELIGEEVDNLLLEIERANKGLAGEVERIRQMKNYLALRKENYKGHIGEYNYILRIKEYNHYLTCWENYFHYQFKRDCCIAELQNFLCGSSVMDFCRIIN